MKRYIIRRLLLVLPTLFGVMLVNFAVVQFAPGGPIEHLIARLEGTELDATSRTQYQNDFQQQRAGTSSDYRGSQGIDPELIRQLEREFGFDKPLYERFWHMLGSYVLFDFGTSFFRDQRVFDLIVSKLPVSISLGLWTTLLTYLICIPLGIRKAVRDGTRFDLWTSGVITVGYAVPSFMLAIFLVVMFAGGSYLDWFPLRGIVSDDFGTLSLGEQIIDYLWHMVLPVTALVAGGFAGLTMLTKNSFLDEINKQYVITARSKGLSERRVLYGHVFRNAMLIVIAGFPGAFVGILFTGSLLIEVIFSLDGIGLLGFEAAVSRDYPVVFGTLYLFTLLGLLLNLLGDLMYVVVDPRINFESQSF